MMGLIRRAREERLPQVAGSLTFTTVLAVVPLLAVSFALFDRIHLLRSLGVTIQRHLVEGLVPAELARTVLHLVGRFAHNANSLPWIGSVFLAGSAFALLLTVESVLNGIWQVRAPRPWLQRLGLYLLLLALGPPALGASLWATSYVLEARSHGHGAATAWLLEAGPVLLGMAGLACLYYFVPHTEVRRRDAIIGGLLASIVLELGKRGFAAYLLKVPTYKTIYGAFAALPLFLLWVYFSWVVTLAAALVAAHMGPAKGRAAPPPRRRKNP